MKALKTRHRFAGRQEFSRFRFYSAEYFFEIVRPIDIYQTYMHILKHLKNKDELYHNYNKQLIYTVNFVPADDLIKGRKFSSGCHQGFISRQQQQQKAKENKPGNN